MGLGNVNENQGLFLTLAGGFIWDRKADESNVHYAEQTYEKADKTTGVRKGARYQDLIGLVTNVVFRTHEEFGENINVTFESGEESYVLSIGIESRYFGDMTKALLVADLSKPLYIRPYDFVGKDKKRTMGISFKQDGEKLDLKVDGQPFKDKDWFASANKREIKRFFEDVADYFVGRVKAEICPKFAGANQERANKKAETPVTGKVTSKEEKQTLPPASAPAKVESELKTDTPLKMKKVIRAFIADNYPDKETPELKGDELIKWYNLALNEEELPFDVAPAAAAQVSGANLEAQLDKLLG